MSPSYLIDFCYQRVLSSFQTTRETSLSVRFLPSRRRGRERKTAPFCNKKEKKKDCPQNPDSFLFHGFQEPDKNTPLVVWNHGNATLGDVAMSAHWPMLWFNVHGRVYYYEGPYTIFYNYYYWGPSHEAAESLRSFSPFCVRSHPFARRKKSVKTNSNMKKRNTGFDWTLLLPTPSCLVLHTIKLLLPHFPISCDSFVSYNNKI